MQVGGGRILELEEQVALLKQSHLYLLEDYIDTQGLSLDQIYGNKYFTYTGQYKKYKCNMPLRITFTGFTSKQGSSGSVYNEYHWEVFKGTQLMQFNSTELETVNVVYQKDEIIEVRTMSGTSGFKAALMISNFEVIK